MYELRRQAGDHKRRLLAPMGRYSGILCLLPVLMLQALNKSWDILIKR